MTSNADQIRVGANGTVHVGVFGAVTLPTDINDTYGAGWADVGYTSDKGVTFESGLTIKDIPVWQSFYPARKIVTARESMSTMELIQWNSETVVLAFGGGTISATANGTRYSPPEPGTIDLRSLVIDYVDGTVLNRIVVPKCMVTDKVTTTIARTDAALLPLVLSAIGEDGQDPWYKLTNETY